MQRFGLVLNMNRTRPGPFMSPPAPLKDEPTFSPSLRWSSYDSSSTRPPNFFLNWPLAQGGLDGVTLKWLKSNGPKWLKSILFGVILSQSGYSGKWAKVNHLEQLVRLFYQDQDNNFDHASTNPAYDCFSSPTYYLNPGVVRNTSKVIPANIKIITLYHGQQ